VSATPNLGQIPQPSATSVARPERYLGRREDAGPNPTARRYESRGLLRSRTCSSASSCDILRRWPSISSRCRCASRARSAAVSAMNAAASSGPPSPLGSSARGCRFLPADARLRRSLFFSVKNDIQHCVFRKNILFPECNYGTHFTTFLTLSLDRLGSLQHLSI
jgi:hypothetical protein